MSDPVLCACRAESDYKFHTPSYCGSVPYDRAFPAYSLDPQYRKEFPRTRTNSVKVDLTLQLPTGGDISTEAQIEEWLRYKFGDISLLHQSPISDKAIPVPVSFGWSWSL